MAGACFGGSGKLVEVLAGGLFGVEGTVVGTALRRWIRDGCQSSREVALSSRDGQVLRFGGESGTAVGHRGRLHRRRGDGGRYRVLEVGPGQLLAVAGGCAGVGGRWSVLRLGGESGTPVGHRAKLSGVDGTVVGTAFLCGSGRVLRDAPPCELSNRRLLLARLELVGKGYSPCSSHPRAAIVAAQQKRKAVMWHQGALEGGDSARPQTGTV